MVRFDSEGIHPESKESSIEDDINKTLQNARYVDSSSTALAPDEFKPVSENSSYNSDQELLDIKAQYKRYYAQDQDLCNVLRKLGLGETVIVKVIDSFTLLNTRKIILNIVSGNPYRLMDIEGFGFKKADAVAIQLGISYSDPRRQKALIKGVLESNKNFGNSFLHTTILKKECGKEGVIQYDDRIQEMINDGEIILDENRIYLKYLYVCECEVADMLRELCGQSVVEHKYRTPELAKMDFKSGASEISDDDIPF
jgi:hypothetical protein